ncbi:class I SAM-dependent methyltransferase [Streptomyces sp. AJS327]|uniref:class I SAM-dependent methyltransferase n=1 Tax=Streptomyces sp. AJS327 TaxID=2545265 RepID=UPI0015DF3E47|nr:class I SAM-dependent methyltransferase [Streptomyces sp. AJS327]MBA0052215.1 class I SAM-dependent methyltransferase [Streptomyces sp. AJS327]
MRNDWMLDELAHAGPEHLTPDFVTGFDRKQGYPDPSEDLDLLAAHGLDHTATVLDVGAGTGQFALRAARRFGRVVAVEISPAMRAALRARAEEEGLDRLECVAAGFLSYTHEGPPADAVFSRHALHQLPDFWKALALTRLAATLRPGGLLRLRDLIYDVQPTEAEPLLDDWLRQAHPDPATGYTVEDLATHVRTEYSTFRWLLEPMLDQAGFDILDVRYEHRVFGSYLCVKR